MVAGSWWRNTVLQQLSRSPATAAVLFLALDDGDEVITFPRLHWGVVAAAFAAVLGIAIGLMVLASSAHFEEPRTPAPNPPASCAPFCPSPT
ncbi:hypothetical protein [Nocardia seriolae]|uniref:Uncharacterized protein n=1 Tax=Nocardia seriolae TaxID=37332 RepID=A0A0B8NRL7_9NOCA|nr:hypothetical protein [Nocardia seriolae]MTJ63045.1 hypothetical protein [Nocardia seriolae]MTJ76003.1 hypothetical protein [Nocardia seriolae]MTJ89146.1 hypothetical protein [Nocardia seriolae]MTK33124.1 hypothetical protein [Nocardia seriolae]MTK40939.1 hypothetical protein [Nocardia seriolae]